MKPSTVLIMAMAVYLALGVLAFKFGSKCSEKFPVNISHTRVIGR